MTVVLTSNREAFAILTRADEGSLETISPRETISRSGALF